MTTGFQNIVETNHIRLDIGIWILNGVAHTSLSSQIHHHIELIFRKQGINSCLIGNIALDELPCRTSRNALVQLVHTIVLQRHIIIGIHIVDADNRGPCVVLEEALHQITANETSSTCHQNGFIIEIYLFHYVYS